MSGIRRKTKKRLELKLQEKYEVVQKLKSKISQRKIASEFGISVGQVNAISKKEKDIVAAFQANKPSSRCRILEKKTGNENINDHAWKWFCQMRQKNLPITGPLLKQIALDFAKQHKITAFKASEGWLTRFKSRHNIEFKHINGEAADVNMDTVEEWKTKLKDLTKNFDAADIFNADETGLFFRALPNKTLAERSKKCVGGKMSKERLTVMLCASFTGEKLKPLVIGKSAKPRCFKNVNIASMPVHYKSNRKAWMTFNIFSEWLESINEMIKREGRKILLFVDNAASHKIMQLSNVSLMFLPPNCTALIQPLDQGVIKTFKAHYRIHFVKKLSLVMEEANSATELTKNINVMDAIHWISMAWDKVTPFTIQRCFYKSGFPCENEQSRIEDQEETAVRELGSGASYWN